MPSIFLKNRTNANRYALYPVAVIALIGLVYVGWVKEPEPEIGSRLSSASMLAQSGAYDEAEDQLEFVFVAEPDNRHGWLIQGLIDERRQIPAKAIQSYRKALSSTEEADLKRDIRLSITDLYRRLLNFKAAHDELDAVVLESGQSSTTFRLGGLIAWQEGRFAQARAEFECGKELDPKNCEFDSLIAGLLIDEARHDEARAVLRKIPATEKSAWPFWQTLARSCMESGDDKGAKEALTTYVQLDQRGRRLLKNDEFWNQHASVDEFGELLND